MDLVQGFIWKTYALLKLKQAAMFCHQSLANTNCYMRVSHILIQLTWTPAILMMGKTDLQHNNIIRSRPAPVVE